MEKSKVLLLAFFLLFLASPCPSVLAEKVLSAADSAAVGFENSNSAVYIVILNPSNVVATESMHIETLSSILGGQESAKRAMIYSYKNTVHGFAARLTSEQAAELAKLPEVLSVMLSRKYSLHKGRLLNLHSSQHP